MITRKWGASLLVLTVLVGVASTVSGRSISIVNKTSQSSITVYMGLSGPNYFSGYNPSSFSPCTFSTTNPYVCQFTVQDSPVTINFDRPSAISPAFTVGNLPWGPCPTTLVEFTLNSGGYDTVDVSLVNGINYKAKVKTADGRTTVIDMNGSNFPYLIKGVYPPGCSTCTGGTPPPWSYPVHVSLNKM